MLCVEALTLRILRRLNKPYAFFKFGRESLLFFTLIFLLISLIINDIHVTLGFEPALLLLDILIHLLQIRVLNLKVAAVLRCSASFCLKVKDLLEKSIL